MFVVNEDHTWVGGCGLRLDRLKARRGLHHDVLLSVSLPSGGILD